VEAKEEEVKEQKNQGGPQPNEQRQQKPNQKPGDAGRKQAEHDKEWREMAEPGQEPGTGQPAS